MCARHMWAAIGVLVLYHEAVCEPGELLSQEVDRALDKYPVPTYLFTAITVAHLLNWLPSSIDPYRAIGSYKKGTK